LGIEQGFARYKELSGHAASDVIKRKRIASLYDFAREHGGALHDLDDELHGVSVACLIDARVRSGSGIVEVGDAALVDVADSEALRLGAELARDPAVFHAEADAVWLITNGDPDNPVELEDGFMLLGQPGGAFRDWMPQAVARYVAAKTSGALPPVPVLIDGRITANERETAQRMLPTDTNLVQLSPHAVTQVRRLWCAPRCLRTFSGLESYVRVSESVPGFARREEAWELARGSFVLPPNAVIVEIGAFMGSGTILLAGARKLRGSGRVHAIDPFDGSGEPFSVPVYQRMLGEAGGGSLRGHFERNLNNADVASWVEVHQGRATEIAARWTTPVDMIFLDGDQSRTGVREAYDSWAPFLKPGGTIIVHNSAPGHRPEQDGSRILVEEEIRPPSYDDIRLMHSMTVARNDGPPAPRLFSYWDQPDLTPVQPTLDDWQAHFPEFTIFGDPDVEPIIEELFPEHPELFRNIRIPTCKSDLALLLLLYKHGGLYVDCHCGVRDPVAIRELLTALDRWELILYDKSRREAPRPDTALDPLNSVMFARPRSPIILRALNTALANLTAHRLAETEHGFRRYHIASLSGPGVLNNTLFVDPESLIAELKPEFSGRARFIPEGDAEPIGRYMHYEYRQPGMHWSERQQHELLFRLSEEPQSGAPVPPLARGSPTKVSVLLLAYNQARFVAEALDSVLMQQTKFNFEILAVDDASVDGTANIILEYARKYPTKIRLILRPFNLGSERASFLDSYQRAKGEYVALLDGDDYWTDARKLQKQVAFMDSNREYSCCGHKNIMLDEWNKTEWVKAGPAHDTDVPIEELICGNPFHTSSVL